MPFLGAATKQSGTNGLKVFVVYYHFGQHFIFRCIAQKFGSTVESNRLQCQVGVIFISA